MLCWGWMRQFPVLYWYEYVSSFIYKSITYCKTGNSSELAVELLQSWTKQSKSLPTKSGLADVKRNVFCKQFMIPWSKSHTNMCSSCMTNNDPIRSQLCTCHNSAAVTACAKLWADWIIRIKIGKKNFHNIWVTSSLAMTWAPIH